MAQSAQAKEVILEIGEETGTVVHTTQEQSGEVEKITFDSCGQIQGCDTGILNANPNLTEFNNWSNLQCSGIEQAGNSPSVWGGGVNPQMFGTGQNSSGSTVSNNYLFDYDYNGAVNEGNIISFNLSTDLGGNPFFNGMDYSNEFAANPRLEVNNMSVDGRENTEQGRLLYLTPKAGSGYTTHISFEILEGTGRTLLVRGPGGQSIGEYLNNNGYASESISYINSAAFWANFDFLISPYVHSASWHYEPSGGITYDSSTESIHASFVPSPNGANNFASMVTEENVFGLRSSGDIFGCESEDTSGYRLSMDVDVLDNCVIEVLTYTDNSFTDLQFALDTEGIIQYGTDWVWRKIESTGSKYVCVPFHYNTCVTEEQQNPNTAGLVGGWSTSVQVQTNGGGNVSQMAGDKHFYNNQYKFIRVVKVNQNLPCSLKLSTFRVENGGYGLKTIKVPTYIDREIVVPSYEYKLLDILDGDKVPLALTFNSGDLKDPSKRSTGYSKTFELPASNRNQKILKSMTADGSHRDDSEIGWKKARISANGIVVFSGYARIEQSITGRGGRYTCHILQDPSYWPELIADKTLDALTFTGHEKSYATIVDSWTKTVDDIPYVYPAINYGKWFKHENNTQHHSINDFHPAVYAKAIVDKIFGDVGYTIDSNFFNSSMFKKLIIPFTSGEDYAASEGSAELGENSGFSSQASLSSQQELDYIDATGSNSEIIRSYYPVLPCQNGCTNYTQGSSGSVQNGYIVPFTGRYIVQYTAQIKTDYPSGLCTNCPAFTGAWTAWVHVNGLCPMQNGSLQNINGGSQGVGISVHDYNLADSATNGSSTWGGMEGSPADTITTCMSKGSWTTALIDIEVNLSQGDEIQIGLYGINEETACGVDGSIRNQQFSVWPVVSQSYVPPVDISLSSSLGGGVKQMDFLKGLTQMFNLYWTADEASKEITVEPYDDFYGSGKVVDWSHKIDRKSWSDKFLIDELAKSITYKYKKDSSDKIVEVHDTAMDKELWDFEITNTALYRKENSTLGTTIFSPTFRIITGGFGGDSTFVNSGQPPVMPCMWGGNPYWTWFQGTSRPDNSTKFNLRILNWGGLSNQTGPWTITNDAGNPVEHNTYPYAYTYNYNHSTSGSLENNLAWHSLQYNLGGTPSAAQYQRGLFDRYYGRLYEKISGGAALRTCMMDLSQADISQFDFRDIIKIDMDGGIATYWSVNKIVDYNPGKDGLTQVQLIEYKYGLPYSKGRPSGEKPGATNYGGLGGGGKAPAGGSGVVLGNGGVEITVQDNGEYYIPPTGTEIPVSNEIKTSNNLTVSNLNPNPQLPNNTHVLSDKFIETNQYNGITNNPSKSNATTNNTIVKNGVAFGLGLHANPNQTVLGSYNKNNSDDSFQVGGGYLNRTTGSIERINAISINKAGEFSVFGGEVVADFSTKEFTMTGDVYTTDSNGRKNKVYLKERIDNR
tara:strand:- start:5534 stop:9880 length:4347 start_codon:yes stop_codon:yes gene_type:complete